MARQTGAALGWVAAVTLGMLGCGGSGGAHQAHGQGVSSAVCGNGVLEPGEQCDDGNQTNLDGCDVSCQFEQVHRLNTVTLLFGTDALCTHDALGAAFGSAAQGNVQSGISDAVKSGAISVLVEFRGLTDLTGAATQGVTLGSMTGLPQDADGGYDGTADLDWWYTAAAADVDTNRVPTASMTGRISNQALTAGPGDLALALSVGGASTNIALSSVTLQATVGAASSPTVAQGALPPGHLASEHLDPSLTSFASLTGGELCGNVSAASLAAVPVPAQLLQGSTACSQGYTRQNSFLDVLVGGCNVWFMQAISPTQPDQVDPSVAPAGTGGPYQLQVGANHAVTGCTDASGAPVDLGACLKAASYSSAFQFTSDRVVVTGVQ